jgi:hypothetical protein
MTDNPPEIYLDPRVAKTIPQEPAGPDSQREQVRYFSAVRVKELIDMARGGPEFIIQITTPPKSSAIFALTNYGRIFQRSSNNSWKPVEGPDLGTDANVRSEGGG